MECALKGAQRRVALAAVLPMLPRDRQWEQACNDIHKIFDHYIDLGINELPKSSVTIKDVSEPRKNSKKRHSMLHELTVQSQDRLFIRDQLLSVFLPLHNGSPIGISNLFFQIARRPEVFQKLRAEVIEMGDVALTFEVLKSMKYVQCVIKESQ